MTPRNEVGGISAGGRAPFLGHNDNVGSKMRLERKWEELAREELLPLTSPRTVSPKSAKIYKIQRMQTALNENSPNSHNDFVSLLLSDDDATSP